MQRVEPSATYCGCSPRGSMQDIDGQESMRFLRTLATCLRCHIQTTKADPCNSSGISANGHCRQGTCRQGRGYPVQRHRASTRAIRSSWRACLSRLILCCLSIGLKCKILERNDCFGIGDFAALDHRQRCASWEDDELSVLSFRCDSSNVGAVGRKRAQEVGGSCTITGNAPRGTVVRATLPLKDAP